MRSTQISQQSSNITATKKGRLIYEASCCHLFFLFTYSLVKRIHEGRTKTDGWKAKRILVHRHIDKLTQVAPGRWTLGIERHRYAIAWPDKLGTDPMAYSGYKFINGRRRGTWEESLK